MKIVILLMFVSVSLFIQTAAYATEVDWFPFTIPLEVDSTTAINAGTIVLDPPAGKHGFVKVKDGHFYFEDGSPIRFWGANCCFTANFINHAHAEKVAAHMAKFGFNIVRIHHVDCWAPIGLLQNDGTTETLSGTQMDNLDYFIYQLKIKGIYVNINLHVGRKFTAADGVIDSTGIPNNSKLVTLFDNRLIELQKDYAQKLLTHLNPYTGTKYVDEPGVALVEITNENTLFPYGYDDRLLGIKPESGNALTPYYISQLDTKWNNWLLQKYGTTAALKAAWGSLLDGESLKSRNIGRARWSERNAYPDQRITDNTAFYYSLEKAYFHDMVSYLHGSLSVRVPLTAANSFFSGPPSLLAQQENDYTDCHNYWDHPVFPKTPWDTNDFTQSNKSLISATSFASGIDYQASTFIGMLSRYSVEGKPFTVSEWNHTYPNDYEYELPTLITTYGRLQDWDGLFVFAYSHESSSVPTKCSFFDVKFNPGKLAQMPACSIAFLRGDVQTAQRTLTLNFSPDGIISRYKNYKHDSFDIDGVLPYSIAYTYKLKKNLSAFQLSRAEELLSSAEISSMMNENVHTSDTRELVWDAQSTGQEFIKFNAPRFQGVNGFVANKTITLDDITFVLQTNCAAYIISLDKQPLRSSNRILLTLVGRQANSGQVKETDNGLSNWGTLPVLLEPVKGTVNIRVGTLANHCKVYPLDVRGNRRTPKNFQASGSTLSLNVGEDATPWYEIIVPAPTLAVPRSLRVH